MDAPLADAAGNAVEMRYAIDYLTGQRREPRLHAVTVALSAEMLLLGGLADDLASASARIEAVIASGQAAEVFARMVAALGGPADILERPDAHLAAPPLIRPVHPDQPGVVAAIDTRAIGVAVVELGGGRTRPQDDVDHAVGLTALAGLGETVGPDRPLALVHARDEAGFARAATRLKAAYRLGTGPASAPPVIERITLADCG
jgi:thymidine phosphorylase